MEKNWKIVSEWEDVLSVAILKRSFKDEIAEEMRHGSQILYELDLKTEEAFISADVDVLFSISRMKKQLIE